MEGCNHGAFTENEVDETATKAHCEYNEGEGGMEAFSISKCPFKIKIRCEIALILAAGYMRILTITRGVGLPFLA